MLSWEQKKIKYHNLILKYVEKFLDKKTNKTVYKASITLEKQSKKIEEEKKKAGRFILATNFLMRIT